MTAGRGLHRPGGGDLRPLDPDRRVRRRVALRLLRGARASRSAPTRRPASLGDMAAGLPGQCPSLYNNFFSCPAVRPDDHRPRRRRRPEHRPGRRRPAVRQGRPSYRRRSAVGRASAARTVAFLDLQEARGPVAGRSTTPDRDDPALDAADRRRRRVVVLIRPSFGVFRFLVHEGFDCVPVNPNEREVLGVAGLPDARRRRRGDRTIRHGRRLPSLRALRGPRPRGRRGRRALPLAPARGGELGGGEIAAEAGLAVVMDRCTAIEWRRVRPRGD